MKNRTRLTLGIASMGLPAVAVAVATASATREDGTMDGTMMEQYTKPSHEELRQTLSPQQLHVTQEGGTERPFENAYWDNKEPGIYVDVVSGEPLFSSIDKFDSGTGWPSFTRPLEESNIVLRDDRSLFMRRVETRSKHAGSHLGHVFEDGPPPRGLRYCINSAALRFVPREQLRQQGYGVYEELFESTQRDRPVVPQSVATLAGGCFWGMEEILRRLPGVLETEAGYTGGHGAQPSYDKVRTGLTGHAEAVRVVFDPRRLSYEELLQTYFKMHDPSTRNRQGNDVGTQYRSAIFVHSEAQRRIAERVKAKVDASGKWPNPVLTTIKSVGEFYPAESYHQDYLVKNPSGYTCHYLRE